MISETELENFDPRFEVVSCFVEHNEKILLLHRQEYKPEGGTWGVPAGKIDAGETPIAAMLRELNQETGLRLSESNLSFFKKLFVRFKDYDFVYYIYHSLLQEQPHIQLNPKEHKDFTWANPIAALKFNLIAELGNCIRLFYEQISI